jgi:hypothetical protein
MLSKALREEGQVSQRESIASTDNYFQLNEGVGSNNPNDGNGYGASVVSRQKLTLHHHHLHTEDGRPNGGAQRSESERSRIKQEACEKVTILSA